MIINTTVDSGVNIMTKFSANGSIPLFVTSANQKKAEIRRRIGFIEKERLLKPMK
jgi:hypothetical protein